MIFVFFIYGLAFFVLGLSILIYPKKDSTFKLADKLWLVAVFGIIHGINEWVDMFILIKGPSEALWLDAAILPVLVISFLFLFQFAVLMILETKNKYPPLKALPFIMFIAWTVLTISSGRWLLLGNIWARYLLGAPATFLAAYALFLQSFEFKKQGLFTVNKGLKLATAALLFYGLFSGLVVPEAGFFPASALNYATFLDLTGIPVQVFRSICAVFLAYAFISILGVFEWETKARIKNLFERTQKAYDDLKQLEKTKDSLTHMIVHDLNNPLTAIKIGILTMQMELERMLNEEQKCQVCMSLYIVQEMERMISNLLDINKMEEGKIVLKPEEVDLGSVLREVAEFMKILADNERKRISVSVPAGLAPLRADRDIFKRISYNLIANALKFTPSGSAVEIAAEHNKEKGEVVISVKDHGEGIPREYLHRVFDKFVQVESTGIMERTGKGLGLTFCKMAVEAHGGRIWVESETGKGSTFYFTLPVTPRRAEGEK